MTDYISNIKDKKVGGDNFDGQWKVESFPICAGVSFTKSSAKAYSLADYLPDDGYDYMVAFNGYGRTPSGSGSCTIRVMSGTHTYEEVFNYGCRMMTASYHSTSSYTCSDNLEIPIYANDRNITICNTSGNDTGSCGIAALAYMRIGKNE